MTLERPAILFLRPVLKQFSFFFIFVSAYPALFQTTQAATYIPPQAWSRDINAGGYLDGAPAGGFGAGTYTWNFAGDFYLSRLNIAAAPAAFTSNNPYTVDTNCHFFVYQKPSGQAAVTFQLNASSLGSGQATYRSLYPKAWVDYYGTDFPCKMRVTQFTPMIPGDDTRSSFPEGIYEWDLSNPTCTTTDVAILLTWDNSFGGTNASVTTSGNNTGLVLTRNTGNATTKSQGEFTLATSSSSGVSVTYESAASVATLQSAFNSAGLLANTTGNNTIGGIAFKVTLSPGQSVKIPLAVAWDIPLAQPGTGAQWYREYTRTYGKTGLNSFSIANDALNSYPTWESSIDAWQAGILSGPYPDWFKQMIFNELYYYVIGGTLWEAGQYGSTAYDAGPDMFGSLESYVYAFYGTSDVRFYGSWALAQNWPAIDKQEVEQFCDSVTVTTAQALPRPAAIGTCAHDFGSLNDVFTHWNDYTYRDSTTWKDLNSKLVLMVYRDWELTGKTDSTFLNYCWPAVQLAMTKVHSQCVSTGGVTYNLPISNGIDQTYDNLGLTGETAYCGSLFLAACEAAQAIANQEGNAALANTYQSWLTLGQGDFETNLWNATGNYYNIDTGSGAGGVTGIARIMSDQLCGEWYAKALGLPDVVPAAHAVSAWTAVYNNNFSLFDTGTHGVVNVMTNAGTIDTSTSQSNEAWVGTTWGVVAGMVQEGMFSQGISIGNSLYDTIWNTGQMWFRTPEAWMKGLTGIRAPYYMRANCIWSVKHAYDLNSPCGGVACTPIPSFTPTSTPTLNCALSPTATLTVTPTPSMTRSATPTPTRSPTASSTLTATPSSSPTPTRTVTPANTATATATASQTRTTTSTATLSPTASGTTTGTGTPTASATYSDTRTATSSATGTPTASMTSTPTLTASTTPTASRTSTGTFSPSVTTTASPTSSRTASSTASLTATNTLVNTPSSTPTPSSTATSTSSSTATRTPTPPPTGTSTPTRTATSTATPTPTLTPSSTPAGTATSTDTPTITDSPTDTPTGTLPPTNTPTHTPTSTLTYTSRPTGTDTPTLTPANTATSTSTPTSTPTNTSSATSSRTATNTPSFTPSSTVPATPTDTSSIPATSTVTDSMTPTESSTATLAASPTPTATFPPTVVVGNPYPNPSSGPDVIIPIHGLGSLTVEWDVFTTAFRKIAGGSTSINGSGVVQWDLRDKNGTKVASGLYYLRMEIRKDSNHLRKVLKVLVSR